MLLTSSFNVLIMFLIGLFGFHFSLESLKVIVDTVIENGGFFYFVNFILFLLPSIIMMFFIRDMELENCVLLHKKPLNY